MKQNNNSMVKPDMTLAIISLSSEPQKTLEAYRAREIEELSKTYNSIVCWQYLVDVAKGHSRPITEYSKSDDDLEALKTYKSLIDRYEGYKAFINEAHPVKQTSITAAFKSGFDVDSFLDRVESLPDADFGREIEKVKDSLLVGGTELQRLLLTVFTDVPAVSILNDAIAGHLLNKPKRAPRKAVTRKRIR